MFVIQNYMHSIACTLFFNCYLSCVRAFALYLRSVQFSIVPSHMLSFYWCQCNDSFVCCLPQCILQDIRSAVMRYLIWQHEWHCSNSNRQTYEIRNSFCPFTIPFNSFFNWFKQAQQWHTVPTTPPPLPPPPPPPTCLKTSIGKRRLVTFLIICWYVDVYLFIWTSSYRQACETHSHVPTVHSHICIWPQWHTCTLQGTRDKYRTRIVSRFVLRPELSI